ncbi:MAG TPA: hypothetical protein VFH47_01400 [Candidatus Thermoplasmatota archaeon]|nr:hypothetical protein [Candidatus Thermoplasmatota archaeon]
MESAPALPPAAGPSDRRPGGLRARLRGHLAGAQNRNAYYLMGNAVVGAAAGVLFWLILARLLQLPPSQVGLGYTVVALGTIVGLVAKGGFDTAIVRLVPATSREGGRRLLRLGVLLGCTAALLLTAALALASALAGVGPKAATSGWILVAAMGMLLVVTWLEDAYFLAEGDARFSLHRNLVFSAARLVLPVPLVLWGAPQAIALAWALALLCSALAALAFARNVPPREGGVPDGRAFVRSAARNVTGSAAEFLPGLLLAPIVLALAGPAAAAYFGIAWTAASILFLMSASVSRSALAQMVREPAAEAACLRRAVRQNLAVLGPLAVAGAAVGPFALRLFGPGYAANGGPVLVLLCLSVAFVAPAYIHLAWLRAHERPWGLVLFPAAMVAALLVLTPALEARLGLVGVAVAWLLANAPFGAWGAWRLRHAMKEVKDAPAPVRGPAHLE